MECNFCKEEAEYREVCVFCKNIDSEIRWSCKNHYFYLTKVYHREQPYYCNNCLKEKGERNVWR